MNEEFKDMKFYRPPPAKPRAPIPPAPKREAQTSSICFINNPKSLPTDLRKFERPRQYHEQLKLLPKLPYKPPVILPAKKSDLRLKAKVFALRGSARDPPGIERHVMQAFGARLKKISALPRPLQLKRKKVADYAGFDANEEEVKPGALTSAELKRIAPDGGAASIKKFQFKKKTRQVFEQDTKARELRLREANPWRSSGEWLKEALLRDTLLWIYNFEPRPNYHIPTAEETEALLNAKKKVNMDKWFALTKTRTGDKEEENYHDDTKFNAVEKEDGEDEEEARGGGDDVEDLDFDEDFQDDEEMGQDSAYEETKENEERLKKKQKRLNPASESSDEDAQTKKPTDSSVKKLKRMVKTEDALDSDSDLGSDSDFEQDAPVKKMELPVEPKIKPKLNLKPVVKPAPTPSEKLPPTAAPPKPRVTSDSPEWLNPQFVATTVKRNPGITMKDLIKKLGLNTLKISPDQKKGVINMLNSVLLKPKPGEPLQLHSDYL
ncbi:transcription factor IIF subunit tfg1 [Massospora cicadina]|nr:transcription factor IIF subunit tfg1 [Massospora cicadina]